jgi:hypothetical protein
MLFCVLRQGVGVDRNPLFEPGSFFLRQGLGGCSELDDALVNIVLSRLGAVVIV